MLPKIQYISLVVGRIEVVKNMEVTAIAELFTVVVMCLSLDRGGTTKSIHEETKDMEMEDMIKMCRKDKIMGMIEVVIEDMDRAQIKKSISIFEEDTEVVETKTTKDLQASSKTINVKWLNQLQAKEAQPNLPPF